MSSSSDRVRRHRGATTQARCERRDRSPVERVVDQTQSRRRLAATQCEAGGRHVRQRLLNDLPVARLPVAAGCARPCVFGGCTVRAARSGGSSRSSKRGMGRGRLRFPGPRPEGCPDRSHRSLRRRCAPRTQHRGSLSSMVLFGFPAGTRERLGSTVGDSPPEGKRAVVASSARVASERRFVSASTRQARKNNPART